MKINELIKTLDKDSLIKIYDENETLIYSGKPQFNTYIADLDYINETKKDDYSFLLNIANKYKCSINYYDEYIVIFEGDYKALMSLLTGKEFDLDINSATYNINNKYKKLLNKQIIHINPLSNSREEFLEIYIV